MDGTVGEQLADFRVELQDSSRTAGGLNVRAQVKADAAMALQETAGSSLKRQYRNRNRSNSGAQAA